METYTQGVCQDGAAILCDGKPLTIDEVIKRLNELTQIKYDHIEVIKNIEHLTKRIKEF